MGYIHVSTTGTSRNPIGSVACKSMLIVVGFGEAALYRNSKRVLNGERDTPKKYRDKSRDGYLSVRMCEKYAARRAPSNWEIRIDAPLWSATWRRVRPGKWVCVEAGMGFA